MVKFGTSVECSLRRCFSEFLLVKWLPSFNSQYMVSFLTLQFIDKRRQSLIHHRKHCRGFEATELWKTWPTSSLSRLASQFTFSEILSHSVVRQQLLTSLSKAEMDVKKILFPTFLLFPLPTRTNDVSHNVLLELIVYSRYRLSLCVILVMRNQSDKSSNIIIIK